MFKITIEESIESGSPTEPTKFIKRFEQCVDELDLRAVISAVNAKPRKPRMPAKKEQTK